MERVFDIGTHREVFWDDYLVDLRYTTAERILHHPVRKEVVMKCSEAWEGDCCYFFNVLKDDDRYRMYYEARNTPEIYAEETPDADRNLFRLCYAESRDGLHWVKPSLGICTFDGSTDNNIIWDADKDDWHDPTAWGESIFVMKDTNPACPPEERYKGIHGVFRHNNKKVTEHTLKCLVSADGIHFRFGWYIYAHDRFFDSLNTVLYDETEGKYICYFRGWHTSGDLKNNAGISAGKDSTRDIRRMESPDFKNWSDPKIIEFGEDAPDFHLYINNIQKYPRAPHLLVGFPARYPERTVWTDNYDQLCGRTNRLDRMKKTVPRYGYTVTDAMFMFSRDSVHFERPSEAFLRPEPECDWSWVYGDCFAAAGLMELPSDLPGADPELSFLVTHRRWFPEKEGVYLVRHVIRSDGFISRHAGFDSKLLVTKPFLFKGDTLRINFETSAAGYLKVEILDKTGRLIEGYESCEIFGNSIDRKVGFNRKIKDLEGKPIRLRIVMSDADVYSFCFTEEVKE